MCGIIALWRARSGGAATIIDRMTPALRHRGPDSSSSWVDASDSLALGHRRLAIIDPTPDGIQPMISASGRYRIIFNGEFYNFRAVRRELEQLGHGVNSASDTAVALACFDAWGVERALQRLSGMFALAVWDAQMNRLVIARDRIGEKPLYYGWVHGDFVAASELKAFRAHPAWTGVVDPDALSLYVRNNYVPAPYAIYQGIQKLLPGTYTSISRRDVLAGQVPAPTPFWSLATVAIAGSSEIIADDQQAESLVDQKLRHIVGEQMIADVPVGCLLSGGVDSSIVAAIMQQISDRPIQTFTIQFDERAYDESPFAQAVASHLGTDHTTFLLTAEEGMRIIPELPTIYDEPFADSSQVPTVAVSRLARQAVTVCLTGDGGDEVFAGYNRHVELQKIWRRLGWIPFAGRRLVSRGLQALPIGPIDEALRRRKYGVLGDQVQKLGYILGERTLEDMYVRLAVHMSDPGALLMQAGHGIDILHDRRRWPIGLQGMQRILWLESVTSLPDDMLVKVDRASMSASLEMRSPLLDHRLIELAWRLPLQQKIRGGRGKYILRRVLNRYVPSSLIDRPKMGFAVPIDAWLRGPLRDWAEDLLDDQTVRAAGFYNPIAVRSMWNEHLTGRRKWQQQIWGILMFHAWLRAERE